MTEKKADESGWRAKLINIQQKQKLDVSEASI